MAKSSPSAQYQANIESYNEQLAQLKKKLLLSSMLRLVLFLLLCFLIYFFFGNSRLVIGIMVVGIAGFLLLVKRHANLKLARDKQEALVNINETELEVLKRNFQHLPTGEAYKNPQHFFSQDIDLFGDRSFFQYLNRAALNEGQNQLAAILTSNEVTTISEKQAAVKELAEKLNFRQEFSAMAQLIKTETSTAEISHWLSNYKAFVPQFSKWLPTVFSILSAGVLTAYFTDFITGLQLLIWLLIGLGITGAYVKKSNELSKNVGKAHAVFQQYYQLLALLEKTEFTSDLLLQKKEAIRSHEKEASAIFKEFSKTIDAFDQRNNMLFGFLGNAFLLWDLRQGYHLEQWIRKYSDQVEAWFEVIHFIDAYQSLGNFAFNHPDYTFPKIVSGSKVFETTGGAHPLLDPEEAVASDYSIGKEEFFIVTGANMAGKSTFLRTVSLQIMMSNVGLPVCATSCSYSPIKLITSMRTIDSLADDASYFFSELSRLKFIVEEIKKDNYFIILDEILKGTNSTDKAIGSRRFIEKLVRSKSTGIIATHDLSLCQVSETLPQVKNHYFDAEIINDELHFDYTFKDGICQNMNASFLLKKMGIV